ncbi:hypothetical protein LTR49_027841 [Elasticomyces elasticus]|nr:hypothetical protein LTR49_027841 [Elasticomyces elasticus]
MTWPAARLMLQKHLEWDYGYPSEFSSWSVSLLWVLVHAVRKTTVHLGHAANTDIKVYVLDTLTIDAIRVHRTRNLVNLFRLRSISNVDRYSQGEYLVHGRIQDVDGFRAVGLNRLITVGLYERFPGLTPQSAEREYKLYCRSQELRCTYSKTWVVSPGLTSNYRQLGSCFGRSWEAFMTLAFVSIRQRETGTAAIDILLADLYDLPLPPDTETAERTIFVQPGQPDDGFVDTNQLARLLRLLRQSCPLHTTDTWSGSGDMSALTELTGGLTLVGNQKTRRARSIMATQPRMQKSAREKKAVKRAQGINVRHLHGYSQVDVCIPEQA